MDNNQTPTQDEYSAIWLSHSSMGDFIKCPRAYYLNNMYRNPKTRRKISLIQPPLALGQALHATLDALSTIPSSERFSIPLMERYEHAWQAVTGKKGGFQDEEQEKMYKERGKIMIERVEAHPGPLLNKTVKIKQDLPHYWLSQAENLILCGRIDWLMYDEVHDSVQILDFKTGRIMEKSDSLQLPIYYLLAKNTQSRPVTKVCYWYLDMNDDLTEMELPNETISEQRILEIGRRIKLARQMEHFKCKENKPEGCIHCAPLEIIVNGHADFVGVNDYNQEVYMLDQSKFNYSLTKED